MINKFKYRQIKENFLIHVYDILMHQYMSQEITHNELEKEYEEIKKKGR